MKKNGFIASALLYGMLALFLIMMLSTLAVLANRKLSVDKLKQNAITSAETGYSSPENILALYDAIQKPGTNNKWKDQSGQGNDATVSGNINKTNLKFLQFNGGYISTPFSQQQLKNYFTTEDPTITAEDPNITIVTTLKFNASPNNQVLWGYYKEFDQTKTNVTEKQGKGMYAITDGSNLKICMFDDRCTINEEYCKKGFNDGSTDTNAYNDSHNENCTTINNVAGSIHQIVVTIGNSGITTYKDGIYQNNQVTLGSFCQTAAPCTSEKKATFLPYSDSPGTFVIGKKDGATSASFKGQIYNFIVYNGSLSDAEDISVNLNVDKEKYGF